MIAQRKAIELARANPAWFAYLASGGRWVPADHLKLIARKLIDVAQGRCKRLIIAMPPRHGKSEIVSRWFPAWYLGNYPDRRIILASYESSFAQSWGRKARDLFAEFGPAYFSQNLSPMVQAAAAWDVEGTGGGMVTAGVGGAITGKGAHIFIIDDPVKNSEEADSPTYREKAWEWYQSTAYSRLESRPDGAMIVMATRWHNDDLTGRLIQQMESGGEHWDVLSLPAIAEADDPLGRKPGEPLWEWRFPIERLESIRRDLDLRWWSALYQQQPVTAEGRLLRRELFKVAEHAPMLSRWVRYWDLAVSTKQTADYTASAAVSMGDSGEIFIRDMIHGRWEWPDASKIIQQTMIADSQSEHGIEKANHGLAAVQELLREPELAGIAFEGIDVDRDKVTRALPLSTRLKQGKVYLVRGRWINEFLAEAETFPFGANDDQIDTITGGLAMLSRPRLIAGSKTHSMRDSEDAEVLSRVGGKTLASLRS